MARPPLTVVAGGAGTALDEQSAMRAFCADHNGLLKYNNTTRKWLIWGDHRWREDTRKLAVERVYAFCRDLAQQGQTRKLRFARSVEEAARVQPEFSTAAEDWDADPMLLGTPGGVVNLTTGELRDGRPEDMISKATAFTPSETADCPRWKRFLSEALEGREDEIAFFKRHCGYALTGSVKEEALLYIAGKPGTGKGTSTKTVVSIMRDYAKLIPSAMLTNNKWKSEEYYRADLYGVRLCLASEPEKGAVWADAFVNELTGGDRLKGRVPAGQPFEFDPTFKLWIQGEQIPDVKSVSTGLTRRLQLLGFEVQPREPDHNLKEILRAEGRAILRWMIDGCVEWGRHGLRPPETVKAAAKAYFQLQDRMKRWIEDCCEVHSIYKTKPSVLRTSYNNWADRNGEDRMSFSAFHQAIEHAGFKRKELDGSPYIHGLGLRPDRDKPNDEW